MTNGGNARTINVEVRSQGVRRLGYQRKAMQTDGYTNDD